MKTKRVEFEPFSFNPIEFDGFNRVEFDAVAKTVGKHSNPDFNYGEYATIRNQAGLNS